MKKYFILLAAIFLLAAGCGAQKTYQRAPGTDDTNLEKVEQQATSTKASGSQTASSGQTQAKQNADSEDYQPGVRPWFTQTVEGSKYNQPKTQFMVGQTALEVLDATHQITTQDYGSMGKFVLSIDGVAPDNKHFWAFYVNGKQSNVGASFYKLLANDKIEWKLEAISSLGE